MWEHICSFYCCSVYTCAHLNNMYRCVYAQYACIKHITNCAHFNSLCFQVRFLNLWLHKRLCLCLHSFVFCSLRIYYIVVWQFFRQFSNVPYIYIYKCNICTACFSFFGSVWIFNTYNSISFALLRFTFFFLPSKLFFLAQLSQRKR